MKSCVHLLNLDLLYAKFCVSSLAQSLTSLLRVEPNARLQGNIEQSAFLSWMDQQGGGFLPKALFYLSSYKKKSE